MLDRIWFFDLRTNLVGILDDFWFFGYEKELGFFRIGSGYFHSPFRYKDAMPLHPHIEQKCPIFGM